MILGNFIFAVPHFQNTRNCSFKYFKSSDIIAAYCCKSLSVKISLHEGLMYYESVHQPVPALPVAIGNTQVIFKKNQLALLLIEYPGVTISYFPRFFKREDGFSDAGTTSLHNR